MAIPEEVWRIPLRILLTVVLALLLYLGLKLAFLLFQVRKYVCRYTFSEVRMYWSVHDRVILYTFFIILLQVFQELFVLLTISIGHIWCVRTWPATRSILQVCIILYFRSPRMKRWRIHPYICRSAKLDNHVLEECYRFHMSAFEALETLE